MGIKAKFMEQSQNFKMKYKSIYGFCTPLLFDLSSVEQLVKLQFKIGFSHIESPALPAHKHGVVISIRTLKKRLRSSGSVRRKYKADCLLSSFVKFLLKATTLFIYLYYIYSNIFGTLVLFCGWMDLLLFQILRIHPAKLHANTVYMPPQTPVVVVLLWS